MKLGPPLTEAVVASVTLEATTRYAASPVAATCVRGRSLDASEPVPGCDCPSCTGVSADHPSRVPHGVVAKDGPEPADRAGSDPVCCSREPIRVGGDRRHCEHRQGLNDGSSSQAKEMHGGPIMTSSGAAATYWCQIRAEFSPEFIGEIDGLLTTYTC